MNSLDEVDKNGDMSPFFRLWIYDEVCNGKGRLYNDWIKWIESIICERI